MRVTLMAASALLAATFSPITTALAECRFEGGRIAFGDNDPLAARSRVAVTAIGELTLRCDGGGEVEVELMLQPDPDSEFAGAGLAVELYQDSARRVRWGNGRSGGQPIIRRVIADGHRVSVPVFGLLRATSAGPPGQYFAQMRIEVRTREPLR